MENLCVIGIIILTIVLLKFVLKISLKKAKELNEDKKLEELTDRFPENIEIAKEMLEMLNNKDVTIEEAKNTSTSLYIVATNKILIADLKNNYARIQTIAHECLHSIQDKTLLLFNFIFSNISILYFIIISILTACGIIKNTMIQIFILTIFALIKLLIRGYLEIDAMTKAKYLAGEYIDKKKLLSEDEKEELLNKYEEINKQGIPFTLFYILSNSFLGIIIYAIISCV